MCCEHMHVVDCVCSVQCALQVVSDYRSITTPSWVWRIFTYAHAQNVKRAEDVSALNQVYTFVDASASQIH